MNELGLFLQEEDGVAVIEIVLILLVLIALVVLFKTQITKTLKTLSKRNWKLQFTITDAHDRIRKSAASPHAIGAGKRIYLNRLL